MKYPQGDQCQHHSSVAGENARVHRSQVIFLNVIWLVNFRIGASTPSHPIPESEFLVSTL